MRIKFGELVRPAIDNLSQCFSSDRLPNSNVLNFICLFCHFCTSFEVVRVKAGHCPRSLKVVPSGRGCVCDDDCPGDDKCCVFDCGAVCVPPAFSKPFWTLTLLLWQMGIVERKTDTHKNKTRTDVKRA